MTKNFSVLEARMSREARARSDAIRREHVAEMPSNGSQLSGAYASVWDALSDTSAEAANLRVRSELMQQLAAVIQGRGWTPAEAAHYAGIDPSHVDDLLRGSMSRFSLDALIDISAKLGQQVRIRRESR